MDYKKIGEYITNKRKEKKLTQQELADKIHVSVKAISKWECGKGIPEISNLQSLAKELDVSIIDILNGKDSKKEDAVVEYVKKKDNEIKKIFALLFIMLFLLFMSSFLVLFVKYKKFYNVNYNNNRIIKFSGGTEKIGYNDMLLVISPKKRVLVTGRILSNTSDIKNEDFVGYSIYYKEKMIVSRGCRGNCFSNLMPLVHIENTGYDELFTEESVVDVKNWVVEIYYKVGKDTNKEIIELSSEEISKSNKFYNTIDEPISANEEKSTDEDEEYNESYKECSNYYLVDEAVQHGFGLPEDRACELYKKLGELESYGVVLKDKQFDYLNNSYWLSSNKKNRIKLNADNDGEIYEYYYYYDTGKQKCLKGKCPKPNMEMIEKFVSLTNEYFTNEKQFTK